MEEADKHKSLRILMTADTVGGVWSYSVELCRALQPYNVHFFLVTTGAPMQTVQKAEIEDLPNVSVYETDFLLEWMDSPWSSIDRGGKWLLQLEKELQPDLIHLNCYAYGALSWKAPVMVVTHSDVYSWWFSVHGETPPKEWEEYHKRVRSGLQAADLIIAPSAAMMNFIRKFYPAITPGKVIYNGRNGETFYPAQKQAYVFSMGRIWDEAKNIQLLIDAAPHIRYPVRLAGSNRFGGNNTITSSANVLYLGRLSTVEIAEQLSTAAVYVLPALYEPFGLSVLEAALSGCALVIGDIPSLREIWNESAVYVDTNNAIALSEKVNYLLENEAERLEYATKSMEQAKKYSTRLMAQSYLQTYHQLLQNQKLPTQKELA